MGLQEPVNPQKTVFFEQSDNAVAIAEEVPVSSVALTENICIVKIKRHGGKHRDSREIRILI